MPAHDAFAARSYYFNGGDVRDYPRCMTACLARWAENTPENLFLAQREGAQRTWRQLTFGEAMARIERLAEALLQHGASVDRPVVVLSGNSIEHALLACAAMHVGIPYVPVSPSYALRSQDYSKLRHILELVTPSIIYVEEEAPFAAALKALCPQETLGVKPSSLQVPALLCLARHAGDCTTTLDDFMASHASARVAESHARVTPESIAKLLFTSGSTGMPKAVVNTQRMLCSNQAMLEQRLDFLAREKPVLVDWLPWHHTFGGNTILGIAMYYGGTLYIDDGNPTQEGVQRTVENLCEISPTFYCNVPKGFEALSKHLESNTALCTSLFRRLNMFHFGGATLPAHMRAALSRAGITASGEAVPILAGMGATEACLAFCTDEASEIPGLIGRPMPGMEVKLVATEDKWEARLKGPNVTPGYWRDARRTRDAFDDEGFYCTGDAMRFIDPQRPERGLVFDGRLSENFKLITGTWVNVGMLRLHLVEHFSPLVQDIVIVGEGQEFLGGLVVLNIALCQQYFPHLQDVSLETLACDATLQQCLAEKLHHHRQGQSSSMCLERLMLLDTPLSIDQGEVTDKGSVNQRLVRERYVHHVRALYAEGKGHPLLIHPPE
ncbi:feruloyl-CoA synthase [Halomonas binhaiensis]|uniref:Feruloyl-CoA synthase n=2 Tax=Halomonas binhaiensis TaxID=2562282 RepID=A0A5C1NNN1_9GAMM|nr:feruloyl-CoA synthase [Halomonas binhaiensis]